MSVGKSSDPNAPAEHGCLRVCADIGTAVNAIADKTIKVVIWDSLRYMLFPHLKIYLYCIK
jgi:hypothetical protein